MSIINTLLFILFLYNRPVVEPPVAPQSVPEMIIGLGGDENALRIADCESSMGTNLINKRSSAKGVYQFIDKTWENYCQGDVMNNEDNVKCFLKLYPIHPEWWVCK